MSAPPLPRNGLLFSSLGCAVSIVVVAGTAWATRQPCLAPPLGATALLCFRAPGSAVTSPRNILLGHALGMTCGWLALLLTGALGLPSALSGEFTPQHAAAAAIALGLTVLTTEGLGVPHPPSGATTLIVGLGLLQAPVQFLAVEAGAALVAACAFGAHRLRGKHYPRWSAVDPLVR